MLISPSTSPAGIISSYFHGDCVNWHQQLLFPPFTHVQYHSTCYWCINSHLHLPCRDQTGHLLPCFSNLSERCMFSTYRNSLSVTSAGDDIICASCLEHKEQNYIPILFWKSNMTFLTRSLCPVSRLILWEWWNRIKWSDDFFSKRYCNIIWFVALDVTGSK